MKSRPCLCIKVSGFSICDLDIDGRILVRHCVYCAISVALCLSTRTDHVARYSVSS
jgi:hypothetical protein